MVNVLMPLCVNTTFLKLKLQMLLAEKKIKNAQFQRAALDVKTVLQLVQDKVTFNVILEIK